MQKKQASIHECIWVRVMGESMNNSEYTTGKSNIRLSLNPFRILGIEMHQKLKCFLSKERTSERESGRREIMLLD